MEVFGEHEIPSHEREAGNDRTLLEGKNKILQILLIIILVAIIAFILGWIMGDMNSKTKIALKTSSIKTNSSIFN